MPSCHHLPTALIRGHTYQGLASSIASEPPNPGPLHSLKICQAASTTNHVENVSSHVPGQPLSRQVGVSQNVGLAVLCCFIGLAESYAIEERLTYSHVDRRYGAIALNAGVDVLEARGGIPDCHGVEWD